MTDTLVSANIWFSIDVDTAADLDDLAIVLGDTDTCFAAFGETLRDAIRSSYIKEPYGEGFHALDFDFETTEWVWFGLVRIFNTYNETATRAATRDAVAYLARRCEAIALADVA